MLLDLKLFERWHEYGEVAMTYEELAKLVSCGETLLRRYSPSGNWEKLDCFYGLFCVNVGVRRNNAESFSCVEHLVLHLEANNLLEEVSPGKFKQTAFTLALIDPSFGAWIDLSYCIKVLSGL